jgi:hypothetical protein
MSLRVMAKKESTIHEGLDAQLCRGDGEEEISPLRICGAEVEWYWEI